MALAATAVISRRCPSPIWPGGREGTRSPDLLRVEQALFQLSYSPLWYPARELNAVRPAYKAGALPVS